MATLCEQDINCLPLWRWSSTSDMIAPPTSDPQGLIARIFQTITSMGDVLGRLFYLLAGIVWNLLAAVMQKTHSSLVDASVFADEIASAVYRDVPDTILILVGIGVLVGIFTLPKDQKVQGYGRRALKRLVVAGVTVAVSAAIITASHLDYQRGADEPAQVAGSPSWMVMKLSDWAEPVIDPLTDNTVEVRGSTWETSGGAVDCGVWANRLTSHARDSEEVPAVAVSTSMLWERLYYDLWADTAYGDAAGEVSCVAAEWNAGFDGWEVDRVACATQSRSPVFSPPNYGAGTPISVFDCKWGESDVLPAEPARNKHLVWAPPSDRRLEGRLLAPFFLCSYDSENQSWGMNREAGGWREMPTYTNSLSFQPADVAEACDAWWSAVQMDVPDCSRWGEELLCFSEFPPFDIDPGELAKDLEQRGELASCEEGSRWRRYTDTAFEYTDDIPVVRLPDRFLGSKVSSKRDCENANRETAKEILSTVEGIAGEDMRHLGVQLQHRYDAAMTHPMWNDLPSPSSTSDRTVKAFSGEHGNLLLSGFMALINSVTYGILLLASALLVLFGGILLIAAGAMMPVSLLGLAMEHKPRQIAVKALKLAITGLLLSLGGYVIVVVLKLMVFHVVQIFDSDSGSSSSRLFYFLSGLVSLFLLTKFYKAWKQQRNAQGTGAQAGGGVMPDMRSRWRSTDSQIKSSRKQERESYKTQLADYRQNASEEEAKKAGARDASLISATKPSSAARRPVRIPKQQSGGAPPPQQPGGTG